MRARKSEKYVDEVLYIPLSEAMEELGVKRTRIRGMIEVGRMRYVRTTTKLYVLREDVATLKADPNYVAKYAHRGVM